MIRKRFCFGIGSPPDGTLYSDESFDLGPGSNYVLDVDSDDIDIAGQSRKASRDSSRTTGRALPVTVARALPVTVARAAKSHDASSAGR